MTSKDRVPLENYTYIRNPDELFCTEIPKETSAIKINNVKLKLQFVLEDANNSFTNTRILQLNYIWECVRI